MLQTNGHALPILELDVLRTFVAIAETKSFSAAAGIVFRTPSAVSMQIKKLEETLKRPLFTRDARSVALTGDGEILLSYARQLLAINREAVSKFITPDVAGVVRLGAPDDFGERVLPDVLKRFAETHPAVAVDVTIDQSVNLRKRLSAGQLDLMLLTCSSDSVPGDAEVLLTEDIVWGGARGGTAHLRDPLPVSLWEEGCAWRNRALEGLSRDNRSYRVAYMSAHTAGQRAAILADLAVAPLPKSFIGKDVVPLGRADGLPELGPYSIVMVVASGADTPVKAAADHLRASVVAMGASAPLTAAA